MAAQRPDRPRVAIITTAYGPRDHAVAIGSKMIMGVDHIGRVDPPTCDVVSIHIANLVAGDVGVVTAERHGIPLAATVADALCLSGRELAVDGVVLLGEHGPYPINEFGQKLYPRKELFDAVIEVFDHSDRCVPVFLDKHLSYDWAAAQAMYAAHRERGFAMLAGSSLPYCHYAPALAPPSGAALDHVIGFGFGSALPEAYGFHALEVTQHVVEQRVGGETGVAWVRALRGAQVRRAHTEGVWPADLVDAAFATITDATGDPHDQLDRMFAFDVGYRDGQRATTFLTVDGWEDWGYAIRRRDTGAIEAASTRLDPFPRLAHFGALVDDIQQMFHTGVSPVPVERTLTTTGIMAYLLRSLHAGGRRVETPDLAIDYTPPARWSHDPDPYPREITPLGVNLSRTRVAVASADGWIQPLTLDDDGVARHHDALLVAGPLAMIDSGDRILVAGQGAGTDDHGILAPFRIDHGVVVPEPRVSVPGRVACALADDGVRVVVCCYSSGTVSVITDAGVIQTIHYPAGAHPHQALVDTRSGAVLITDLGLDRIAVHRPTDDHDGPDGRLAEDAVIIALPSGSGPRNAVFVGPDRLLLACEVSSEAALIALDRDEGGMISSGGVVDLVRVGEHTPAAQNHPSQVALGGDGESIYLLNRGDDSISTLTIGTDRLGLLAETATGAWPMDLLVDGGAVYVACRDSDEIVVHTEPSLAVSRRIPIARPVAVAAVPVGAGVIRAG